MKMGVIQGRGHWWLLSTHGLVVVALARLGNPTVEEVARATSKSRATVLRTLNDLRSAGIIESHRLGRRNVYRIRTEAHFRHPLMNDRVIGALVELFQAQAPPDVRPTGAKRARSGRRGAGGPARPRRA